MGGATPDKKTADLCTRCTTCTAACPVSRVTPRFPGPKQAGPGAERFRGRKEGPGTEWMDLCLGCRLCELACPSGVNIHGLNLSARARRRGQKGIPFRDWLLSHAALFGRAGSALSPLANRALKRPALKRCLDRFLGIDAGRDLPAYDRQTFRQWFDARPAFRSDRRVAYFHGCYTDTNDADVGKAVVKVLEAAGIEVTLPARTCCGMPALGAGDLKGARRMAEKTMPSLLRAAGSGLDILFSSASCGLMIRHEYGRLLALPGAQTVAAHTLDIFEYLARLEEAGELRLELKALPLRAAYFASCHLKALAIGMPALRLLHKIEGLRVDVIETDCCGLGGAFGFKKEKAPISDEIGADLADEIGEMGPEVVLSDCEGCRMQIAHLTGLKVLHPIQLLRDAMSS